MNKLVENYLEEVYLNEQLYALSSKVQANKHSILAALKSQNPEKVKAALSVLPQIPIDKVHDLAARHITGFSAEYAKAIKKVDGTPEERQIKAIAISTVYALKKNSKIPEVKKALADFKTDPTYAFAIRDIFVALCMLASVYLVYLAGSSVVGGAIAAGGAVLSGIGSILTGFGVGIGFIILAILGILTVGAWYGLVSVASHGVYVN